MTDTFTHFLMDELLPLAEAEYKIDPDPCALDCVEPLTLFAVPLVRDKSCPQLRFWGAKT